MAWDDFGKSWFGVIFNPAGYLIGRKGNSEAAADYKNGHPIENYLDGDESELSYNTVRTQWTDACASKLKSDDVGKSKSNALKACEGAFDSDQWAIEVLDMIQNREDAKQFSTERATQIRTAIFFALVVILVIALILWAIKKYRTS